MDISGALTLVAPTVAIGGALWTRRVIPSLAAGSLAGALVVAGGDPFAAGGSLAKHLYSAVASYDHLRITLFSVAVAVTVGIMGAYGGTAALVRSVERYARGPRGAMVASWLAGGLVFFDDYANCMVVGSSMGPLCDRYQVSRAKLAYIVDSTAAPVASLALVSTWVGYEIGLVGDALPSDVGTALAGLIPAEGSPGFAVFLQALPYRFYSLFTLVFVGAIAISGRDFGPMLAEERECRQRAPQATARVEGKGAAWTGAAPVLTLVGVTLGALLLSGAAALGDGAAAAPLAELVGAGDSYNAMVIGSLSALAVASTLGVWTERWSLPVLVRHGARGAAPIVEALGVLYLAWLMVSVVEDAGTADYLQGLVGPIIPPWALPTVVFLVAGAIAFATGTSFGTMSILIPLAVPLALQLAPETPQILFASTGAVLAGSCLGDHASPISDTTVLSAAGSQVDVVTHVRTQLPYALTTGAIAVLFGYLPAGLGMGPGVLLPLGAAACVLTVWLLGSASDSPGR